MDEESREITLQKLMEARTFLDMMEVLLDKIENLDTRVTNILEPTLMNPETRKKIRIPYMVKDPDAALKYGSGISTFRSYGIIKRRNWLKKVLRKHFNEDTF